MINCQEYLDKGTLDKAEDCYKTILSKEEDNLLQNKSLMKVEP